MMTTQHRKERRQGRFVFGFIICGLALLTLFLNEGRAIKTARSLAEGSHMVRSVSSETADPANEGHLVHLTGEAIPPPDGIADPELKLRFADTLTLKREVGMYQWKKSDKSDAGAYQKVWKDRRISSDKFSDAHQNPRFMAKEKEVIPDDVRVGQFQISGDLVKEIKPRERLLLSEAHLSQLTPGLREKAVLYEGGLYIAHQGPPTPSTPRIGDMKIRFLGARPRVVTIVALQQGHRLVPHQAEAGHTVALLEPGTHTADQMFANAAEENTMLTWFLRFFGFGLMAPAFRLMVPSLRGASGRSSLLRRWADQGMTVFAVTLAGMVSLTVISLAWLIYRPLVGAGILAAALVLFFGVRKFQGNRTDRMRRRKFRSEVMKLARNKGGKLTVVEVMMELETDMQTAKQALDTLAERGVADVQLTDSGVLVYSFYDIQHLGEKEGAKDVLDA